ncbi:MAG: NUDIX hydrolase, partial [Thermoplasmata archaeon]
GGFVEWGESTEQAVVRELEEETGIKAEVEQLICVQSEPSRDPRGHTVSVVYLMKKDFKGDLGGRDDASDARWWPIASLPKLAFDHAEIVKKAIPIIQLREQ